MRWSLPDMFVSSYQEDWGRYHKPQRRPCHWVSQLLRAGCRISQDDALCTAKLAIWSCMMVVSSPSGLTRIVLEAYILTIVLCVPCVFVLLECLAGRVVLSTRVSAFCLFVQFQNKRGGRSANLGSISKEGSDIFDPFQLKAQAHRFTFLLWKIWRSYWSKAYQIFPESSTFTRGSPDDVRRYCPTRAVPNNRMNDSTWHHYPGDSKDQMPSKETPSYKTSVPKST